MVSRKNPTGYPAVNERNIHLFSCELFKGAKDLNLFYKNQPKIDNRQNEIQ